MKINLVVYVLFFYVLFSVVSSLRPSVVSSSNYFSFVVSFYVFFSVLSLGLFIKGKFLTNSFIQSKVNIIYSDISWASSIKT